MDSDYTPADKRAKPPPSEMAVLRQIGSLVVLTVLQSLSYGIMAPMMPIIMTEYFARMFPHDGVIDCSTHPHTDPCIYGSKQADWWSSIFSAAGCACLFFLSPLIGQASDIYGRKPFLIAAQFARVGTPFSIMYFFQFGGSIGPYYVLRFIDSAFGTASVSSAAVADVVSPTNRAAAFGVLFAALVVGFCMSAAIAPLFSKAHILQIAVVLYTLRVVWVVFAVPETLPLSKRTKKHKRVFQNPIRSMSILCRSQLFMHLTMLIALTSFVTNGISQIQLFYLNTVIGFDVKDTARLMLLGGISSILAQVLVLKPLMDCVHEKGVIILSLATHIIDCVMLALSAYYPSKGLIFAITVPSSIGDLSFAAISSLKSINCSEKEQGRLQGAIYGVRAVFEAAGPVIYASIYSQMKEENLLSKAMPFIISGVLYAVGVGVAMSLPIPSQPSTSTPPTPSKGAMPPPLLSPTFAPISPGSMYVVTDDDDDDNDEHRYDDEMLVEPLLGDYASSVYEDA